MQIQALVTVALALAIVSPVFAGEGDATGLKPYLVCEGAELGTQYVLWQKDRSDNGMVQRKGNRPAHFRAHRQSNAGAVHYFFKDETQVSKSIALTVYGDAFLVTYDRNGQQVNSESITCDSAN